MKEKKVFYMPLSILPWESISVGEPGNQTKLTANDKSIGFLQVYESLEDLKKEYGDDKEYATFFGVATDA